MQPMIRQARTNWCFGYYGDFGCPQYGGGGYGSPCVAEKVFIPLYGRRDVNPYRG